MGKLLKIRKTNKNGTLHSFWWTSVNPHVRTINVYRTQAAYLALLSVQIEFKLNALSETKQGSECVNLKIADSLSKM